MNLVSELLELKGKNIWSISATCSVFEAIEMMAEKEVGALTVVDEDGKLAGILSERDYTRKVILNNKTSRGTLVADIMTRDVITVEPDASIDQCMIWMTQNKFRHLPVMSGQIPVGMLTVGDLLKFIIEKQSETIGELESVLFEDQGGEG